jgi:hypothetical protein
MPQINNGKSPPWVAGEIVTAAGLNGMMDSATLDPSAITSQSNFTTLTGDEYTLIVDPATGLLKKTQLKNALLTGEDIKTDSITQTTGSSTTLTIQSNTSVGLLVDGIGGLTLKSQQGNIGIDTTSAGGGGNIAIQSNGMTFDGQGGSATGVINFQTRTIFSNTGAVKIPVGTTVQRPATPATGDLRFNTTTTKLEFYNGSSWISFNEVNTGTYSLYEIFVQNFQSSTTITNVSSSFSKPSNEIWEFEVDYYPTYDSGDYTYIFKAGGARWWYTRFNGVGKPAMLTAKWVIQAGTSLTSETITFDSQVGGGSPKELNREVRIYKYKPTIA